MKLDLDMRSNKFKRPLQLEQFGKFFIHKVHEVQEMQEFQEFQEV